MTEDTRNEVKRRFFERQKVSVQRCLEPSERCGLRAIRAHSIQNAVVLDQLCADGHVIMPRLKIRNNSDPEVAFERVGRNHATTFTGLCAEHDQAIFAPVDSNKIDVRNIEHLFLLAYRSVLRELHAQMTSGIHCQMGYKDNVELGLAPADVPSPDGLVAVERLVMAWDCYRYKKEYDWAYSTSKFGRIQHVQFFEKGVSPSIAVSSVFSLDNIIIGDTVARVVLNIFPHADGVSIVFSFLREHATFIRSFIRPFQRLAGNRLLEMLSVRVLNSCENFVIAPRFWEMMDESDRNEIQEFFAESMIVDGSDLGANAHFIPHFGYRCTYNGAVPGWCKDGSAPSFQRECP